MEYKEGLDDPLAAKAILDDLAEHAGLDMRFTLINWDNIRRKAGPNEQWPGRPCYCYCSTQSLDAPETWLPAVRVEAQAQGWELVIHAGNVYLLGLTQAALKDRVEGLHAHYMHFLMLPNNTFKDQQTRRRVAQELKQAKAELEQRQSHGP